MAKLICSTCMHMFDEKGDGRCPACHTDPSHIFSHKNSDAFLNREVPRIIEERKQIGLDGLVCGLAFVIINTEPDRLKPASEELMATTGLRLDMAFDNNVYQTCVLKVEDSADFLIRSRMSAENPFRQGNHHPKSEHLPNTRLETFVFEAPDLEKYVAIQQSRGVRFTSDTIVEKDHFAYIETVPSTMTNTSLGFIQWTGEKGQYATRKDHRIDWHPDRSDRISLRNIGRLDHTALRVHAENRDAAIIEFMELTNYHFDFAIYVRLFNSITNVARLSDNDFAMVFTSGISPYVNEETSGPTEKFIHNYGTRVHHMAFVTKQIEETIDALKRDGMEFLVDLVGSPDEGLKQTFTIPSQHTLLVNEYIHRYGNFRGFFSKSNVTHLTKATDKQ